MAEEKLEVVRKLKYKKPDNTFEEYLIGAKAENIEVINPISGENDNLQNVLNNIQAKIILFDQLESFFIIAATENFTVRKAMGTTLFFDSKDFNNDININNVESAFLVDSHPLSFLVEKTVKLNNNNKIEIHFINKFNENIEYTPNHKFLLYLTCKDNIAP